MQVKNTEKKMMVITVDCAVMVNLYFTGYLKFYPEMIFMALASIVVGAMVLGNVALFAPGLLTLKRTSRQNVTALSKTLYPSSLNHSPTKAVI